MTDTNAKHAAAEPPQPSFEESLTELETLVDRLEKDDLTLEQSLSLFARGVTLTRSCQQALDSAEQRIRILTEQSVDAPLEPFATDD
ncbi:exodeoxyribonuclease VII small subunit [Thiococcus pfennigii]|jgi:exodeoxyribonuclease VII small subunit|uniref:exodeoxyribonuclease VII small subunit n=1 Tax=Thiococcus pfennigii TaxID=1057 RepID=UPI0019065EAA|nr:exodeoxyribonuclease VII small subunit [Thiococcus pfennigii]MBK1701139.1 exodeoxyribonuclease VII small subunit [Thiococcus pfennigii]MBK1730801.1 exodeoxyribonuclease VII small subunit [Thiococcus pfennigii]